MAGIACNGARKTMLENILNKTAPTDLVLRLYQNNVTPTDGDNVNASGYTEATFTGYSAFTFTASSWSVVASHPSVATYAQQTFTSSADQALQNIYGYYITTLAGNLVFAERFSDGPYGITGNGQTIKVTATISLTD